MASRKSDSRQRRKVRVRQKIHGTAERPRLSIYRSLQHMHAQIIDDRDGKTLIGLSTQSKDFTDRKNAGNIEGAKALGKMVAERALAKKITQVVFDRSGFLYHGRVRAVAEGAREGGLKF